MMRTSRPNLDELAVDLVADDNSVVPKAPHGEGVEVGIEGTSRPGGDDPAGAMKVAQISTPQAGMWTCSRCSARWGGLKTAHCNACHQTFTVVAAFDKHRAGSHTNDERQCLDPAAVGLVYAGRTYSCWGFPGRGQYEGDS